MNNPKTDQNKTNQLSNRAAVNPYSKVMAPPLGKKVKSIICEESMDPTINYENSVYKAICGAGLKRA